MIARTRSHRPARDGKWLVKVQPPLDNSPDAAGGIGRMTPTTPLLHDEAGEYCALVKEEDTGHSSLLRSALRCPNQVAYLWAEDAVDSGGRRVVRVFTQPVAVADRGEGGGDW